MSNNICGNCANFKPKPSEKFFNCTKAIHAGVDYGMQVRADTRSCDAFEPLKPPGVPKPAPKTIKAPAKATPQAAKLCPWGRLIMLAAIILIILLLSWGIYTCAKNLVGAPASTPTPRPTPTPIIGPTPTPMPQFIYQDLEMNQWARSRSQAVYVHSPQKTTYFGGATAPVGTYFISFSVTITNLSLDTIRVSPYSFWLTDKFGTVYQAAGNPVYYPWRYESPTIYPGATASGFIPYYVPSYASELSVNYIIDAASVPPIVGRWKLPW